MTEILKKWEHKNFTTRSINGLNRVVPIGCGSYPKRDPNVIDFCFTDRFSIVYILKGTGVYYDNIHKEIELKPGFLILRPIGVAHKTVPTPDAEWLEFFIDLPLSSINLFEDLGYNLFSPPIWKPGIQEQLILKLEKIQHQLNTLNSTDLSSVLIEMQQFVISAWHFHHQQVTSSETITICGKIANEIYAGEYWDLSIPELASHHSIDYEILRKAFKLYTGESPLSYKNRIRIDRAKELLSNSDFTISVISKQLNYPNLFAFSRAFKKDTGLSPSQYRSIGN